MTILGYSSRWLSTTFDYTDLPGGESGIIDSTPLSRMRTALGSNPTQSSRLFGTILDYTDPPGGESGIRTHGTVAGTAVFKTATFNHSVISPNMPLSEHTYFNG